jgi:putative FmdB family regulatory protein
MPIYEYTCSKCNKQQEILQKFDEEAPLFCPLCGAKNSLHKEISASAFHLKGGGWYKDLYSSKKTASDSKTKEPEAKKPDKKEE